jgi:hypothetical protein
MGRRAGSISGHFRPELVGISTFTAYGSWLGPPMAKVLPPKYTGLVVGVGRLCPRPVLAAGRGWAGGMNSLE